MKKGTRGSPGKPIEDILARVELELTSQQLHSIRTRATTRSCSEEEYIRHLFSDAMLQNVLQPNFAPPDDD